MSARRINQIAGGAALLVSATGVVLSVFAGLAALPFARQTNDAIESSFRQIVDAADSVQHHADAAAAVVSDTRNRIGKIRNSVAQLAQGDGPTGEEIRIAELIDVDVSRQLVAAEEYVGNMQAGIRKASEALQLLDAFPLLRVSGQDHRSQSLSGNLVEVADLLEQVRATLANIRSSKNPVEPEKWNRLAAALSDVDGHIERIVNKIEQFSRRVRKLSKDISKTQRKVRQRIDTVAVMAIVFFVCFGSSQFSLFMHGLKLTRILRRTT